MASGDIVTWDMTRGWPFVLRERAGVTRVITLQHLTKDLWSGQSSVAIIASTELKRERVNNLIQVITDSVGHPADHHELVRHGVHVVHLELGDASVKAGVEEVHEVDELQWKYSSAVMIQIVLFRRRHQQGSTTGPPGAVF